MTELTRGRNLAVTPSKSKGMTSEELKKINHDYPFVGLKSMLAVANSAHPFRFIYTSAALTERDQDRALWVMGEERKLRVSLPSRVHLALPV